MYNVYSIIVAWPKVFTCVRVTILKICMSQSNIFQHLSCIALLVHEIPKHNIFLSKPKLFFQIPCNSVWSSDIKVKITSLFPFLFLYPRVIISVNWDTYHIYIIFLIKPPYKPGRHNRVRWRVLLHEQFLVSLSDIGFVLWHAPCSLSVYLRLRFLQGHPQQPPPTPK